jgi:hypothetical protein
MTRIGERAMSVAERSAAYRARRKAEAEASTVRICYRKPADRRTRPQRWRDAVETLAGSARRLSGLA